jgi:hypothetical protein
MNDETKIALSSYRINLKEKNSIFLKNTTVLFRFLSTPIQLIKLIFIINSLQFIFFYSVSEKQRF